MHSPRLRVLSPLLLSALLALAMILTGCSKAPSSGGVPVPTSEPTPPNEPTTTPPPTEAPAPESPPAGEPAAEPTPSIPAAELGTMDCDPVKIRCRRAPPECPAGQVPSVSGSCFGACVAVEKCACSTAAQCPQSDKHTCWKSKHCGQFVR